jgi:hypothetical protein
MQTLNVGAGRTDEEYKAAEESRRVELRSDVQTYGMYFFIAAGLAGLGTGLLPIRLFGLVNIGFIDLLTFYGGELIKANPLLLRAAAAAWVLAGGRSGLCRPQRPALGLLGRPASLYGGHATPYRHVFHLGFRHSRLLRLSMV